MKRNGDAPLAFMCLIAAALGVYFVADAGYPLAMKSGDGFKFGRSQLVWLVIAVGTYFLCARITDRRWMILGNLLFLCSLVGCVIVLVPGIGTEINNARRWLAMPGFRSLSIQPAEFFKLGAVLFVAWLLEKAPSKPRFRAKPTPWPDRLMKLAPFALVVVGALLIEREPDLGTAMTVVGILVAMLWVGGVSLKVMGGLVASCALAALVMVYLQPYRWSRIVAHENRWSAEHASEVGFQPVRSELGIGTGGLTGVGPGMGVTKHSLPAATTDFIFTTVAEEFGFIGALSILALLGGITGRLIYLSLHAPTRYAALVFAGCAAWIGGQTVLNVLMVTGIIPPVGIPLPFISMGGSSLIALAIGIGAVQALSKPGKEDTQDAASGMRWRHRRSRVSRNSGRIRRGLTGM